MKNNFQNYIFILIASLFFASPLNAQDPNQVTNISTLDQNNQTELKFELKSAPKYRVFTIANPERLVVDFDEAVLVANINDFSHPLFSSMRHSINNQGQLRIVFDLKSSVKINKSAIIKAGENKGENKYYIAINLLPADKNLYKKAPYQPKSADQIGKLIDKETGTVKYVVKKTQALPTIIIDAGHGGKDPGTIGKFARSKEKFVTLGYARELKRQLDQTKKYKVFLTRDQDYFIPLNGRVDKARKVKADLFISLHADSSPDGSTSGLSIYSLSERSSDKQAELLAQKENKSDIIGGADFSDASGDILKTLINLSQRSTMNDSAKFAEIVIKSIRENNVETLQKTHRFAGFRVLTAPDVPSVLIELGYLSNKAEEKKLNSLQHKKEVAEALVDAVGKYFGN
ncbi:MAG: N-acetylmuramoyl-L-alanine amidase [Pseudomonadota bacterium]